MLSTALNWLNPVGPYVITILSTVVFGIFQMAGSRGGLAPGDPSSQQWRLKTLSSLLSKRISLRKLIKTVSGRPGPRHLSIAVNNLCNLSCRHCYLQVKPASRELSSSEWEVVLEMAVTNLPIELVTVVGKEPFVDNRGPRILGTLSQIRRANPAIRFGVVTNGTLLDKMHESLDEWSPDFIDVSLEGVGQINDEIRGRNSFQRTTKNLSLLTHYAPEKTFVLSSLNRLTIDHAAETVEVLSREYGVRRFGLGFFVHTLSTPEDLSPLSSQIEHFAKETLPAINELKLPSRTSIFVDADLHHPFLISQIASTFNINAFDLEVDGFGEIYWERRIGETSLVVKFGILPLGLWESVRLTPEGFVLTSDATLEPSRYHESALGNLLDFELQLDLLLNSLCRERVLTSIFATYSKQVLPALQSAFSYAGPPSELFLSAPADPC